MRYLIDREFRPPKPDRDPTRSPYAAELRRDLSRRAVAWARDFSCACEVSLGGVPAVLYQEDEHGEHGNFLAASYDRIKATPAWARRLTKVHTSAKRALLSRSRDHAYHELDSSNSSDALLMNIFCHPETLERAAVRSLLGIELGAEPVFGYRPRVPLRSGGSDCTEADMRLGGPQDDLLVEAKLTEYDFQMAPLRLIERYRDFEEVFERDALEIAGGVIPSYQLLRGVLAAYATPGRRFCVVCDARRPDLIEAWHRVMRSVTIYDLRSRLQQLTWQELAVVLPDELQVFLDRKYGIRCF